jgi:rod shape-determining protein MreC
MPLGTLDRTPPPFFKQGPTALSRLVVFSALALFLMVADVRLQIVQPLRAVLASLLYPVQWLAMQPTWWLQRGGQYVGDLQQARAQLAQARSSLLLQSQQAAQVAQLSLENRRLRQLLELREQLSTSSQAAEVLYDAADPFTRKIVIDRGLMHDVQAGSPVIDESGVLGQVTRTYPLVSEVTLVTDSDLAIPVLNARTGARSVAFGDTTQDGMLELRFMAGNADVLVGDLLTTSGVDGVYPPGLPVARVAKVERRTDSAFARIVCTPQALVAGTRHALVLQSLTAQLPPRPVRQSAPEAPPGKGPRK